MVHIWSRNTPESGPNETFEANRKVLQNRLKLYESPTAIIWKGTAFIFLNREGFVISTLSEPSKVCAGTLRACTP